MPEYMIATVLSVSSLLVGFILGRLWPRRESVCGATKGSSDGDLVEIYVGNLPYSVQQRELQKMFEKYGAVSSARIIKHNGKSKGFGFVEMANRPQAEKAISALSDQDLKGRKLVVNEAKAKRDEE